MLLSGSQYYKKSQSIRVFSLIYLVLSLLVKNTQFFFYKKLIFLENFLTERHLSQR